MADDCKDCGKFNANQIKVDKHRNMIDNEDSVGWECSFCNSINKWS